MIGCLTETTTCVVAKPLVKIKGFYGMLLIFGRQITTSKQVHPPLKSIPISHPNFLLGISFLIGRVQDIWSYKNL